MTGTVIPPDGWLRRYVDLHAPLSEAPPEAHFASALALLSAAVGWKGTIQWGRTPEPLTLWVILEGQSAAARKTTTSGTALALARHVAAAATGDPRLVAHRISHISDRGLIELVAPKDADQAREWDSDATPPPGVIAEWDEFGGVLGRPGDMKAADWLGRVQARMMEIYGGRHGGIQTAVGKTPGSRCALAIIATMTRKEIEQRVSTGLLETGFMGRFVLIPFQGRTQVLSRPPVWGQHHHHAYQALAAWLGALIDAPGRFGHAFDRLTPAAGDVWDDWYTRRSRELEDRADQTGNPDDAAMYSAFNRLQTTAMKAAAVLAISGWEPGQRLDAVPITEHHVHHGTGIAEHALAEVASLLASNTSGGSHGDFQERVVAFMERRNGDGPITMRELLQRVRGRGLTYRQRKDLVWALSPEILAFREVERGTTRQKTIEISWLPEDVDKV